MDAGQRRAAAKRQQIVDAARRVFLANGFAASSMDAVVAEAGVSKQTLYRYFPSKTDLLVAVLTSEVALAGMFAEPPPTGSPAELRAQLVGLARTVTHEMLTPPRVALMRLIFGEAFRIPELRDTLRDALPAQFMGVVEAILGRASAAGLIRVERPELVSRMFVGSIFSFIALDGFLRADPLPPPPDGDIEHLVDAFLRVVEVPR